MANLTTKSFSRLFYLFFYSWVLVSFLYCTQQDRQTADVNLGGTYRIPITSDISSLDPAWRHFYSWFIGSQIYEGLVTYSKNESEIVPLLAESFQVNDLTYTFHLRKGVKFHDDPCFPGGNGRELTAADVKYSFERPYKIKMSYWKRSPTEKFLGFKEFATGESSQIEGFKVIGKYTFEIRLIKPDPYLLSNLTASDRFIVPKEAVAYYGEDFKFHPVGTGPFRFSEWMPNEKLILVKNENYWGFENNVSLPYLDAVEYIFYSPGESEKMLLDFRTGKLDECTEDVAKHLQEFAKLDEHGNIIFKGWLKDKGVQFVKDKVFRKLRYLEIFERSKKVRQAMSYAVDRKKLVDSQQSIFQNYEVANGPIAPNTIYFNQNLEGQYYDPKKARRLLADAGFPNGDGLPEYPFYYSPSPDADLIVANLRAVGFKIRKIKKHPGWREVFKGPGPLLAWMRNQTIIPEAYAVFGLVEGQPECMAEELFVHTHQAWQENEANFKNLRLLNLLEEIACDISPQVFLYHIGGEFRFLQSYVKGRQLGNAWGHKLHHVWLDKDN